MSHRNQRLAAAAFLIWAVVVLGWYLTLFRDLLSAILAQIGAR